MPDIDIDFANRDVILEKLVSYSIVNLVNFY